MKPKLCKPYIAAENIAGILTWLAVSGSSVFLLIEHHTIPAIQLFGIIALYVFYLLVWIVFTTEENLVKNKRMSGFGLALLFVTVIAIYFLVPFTYNSILMGLICGILPFFVSFKVGLIVVALWSTPLYLIYTYYWQFNNVVISAILFWSFNLFSFIMINALKKEKQAKEQAERASRELISTQTLLKQAVEQGERLRIARNIHDLLGHHLTALSIHLQVASRKTSGSVKDNIDQCHQLSKLLLSDVRDAVSDIREKSKVDLETTIDMIKSHLPSLDIQASVDNNVVLDNIEIADCLIKCIQESITNTLKHAKATKMQVTLSQDNDSVKMQISNDGYLPKTITLGNGLRGMQERVLNLNGEINFDVNTQHFLTTLTVPVK
ncbi:sensor histidine kinase [Agaribacter flavus]|uniref:Sensor histidine kinase n=1 Tax=Agaribacter flavus TaxID=1902781 RepID=A0ABV7FQ78_9ALTE